MHSKRKPAPTGLPQAGRMRVHSGFLVLHLLLFLATIALFAWEGIWAKTQQGSQKLFTFTAQIIKCAMSHKKKGQLTTATEWAKHLRKYLRRQFWKGERKAVKNMIRKDLDENNYR